MTTAEDFLLVATDPTSGKPIVGSMESDAVLGGAILFDLVGLGRLGLDESARKPKVVVLDHTPLADPVLEPAFARVRNRGCQTPQAVVPRLGKGARARIYASLAARGVVRPREEKVLGIFPLTRHDVLDTARRDDLLTRIRACLLHDQPADAETGPIIGLLAASDLLKRFVERPDRRRAKARAKVVAEADWASEGVRKAIQAAQNAMTTGVIAATAAGAAGAS